MELSTQQKQAYDLIIDWFKSPLQYFTLAGYAGTGKSTLANIIAEEIGQDRTVFCAYTGKAAKVLFDKGCKTAGTIHSFLYQYLKNNDGEPVFTYEPTQEIKSCRLIIVDEYSMLSDDILKDLIDAGKKILFLGDPFQLPPFRQNEKIILTPDFFLEEIHRQALDSPILKAATAIRLGKDLDYCDWGDFKYCKSSDLEDSEFLKADQIIVGKNKTRDNLNNSFRKELGMPKDLSINDKIICRQNSKDLGLLNGMIGNCSSNDNYMIGFNCDGQLYNGLKVWKTRFNSVTTKTPYSKHTQTFEYAYAITCHLAQGSEFENIIVFNEAFGDSEQKRRWLYTAVTRGKNKVTLVD